MTSIVESVVIVMPRSGGEDGDWDWVNEKLECVEQFCYLVHDWSWMVQRKHREQGPVCMGQVQRVSPYPDIQMGISSCEGKVYKACAQRVLVYAVRLANQGRGYARGWLGQRKWWSGGCVVWLWRTEYRVWSCTVIWMGCVSDVVRRGSYDGLVMLKIRVMTIGCLPKETWRLRS